MQKVTAINKNTYRMQRQPDVWVDICRVSSSEALYSVVMSSSINYAEMPSIAVLGANRAFCAGVELLNIYK